MTRAVDSKSALALDPQADSGVDLPVRIWSVVALVPAHQEEAQVAATVRSLRAQTYPIEEILVIADNCTDRTEEFARAAGASVMHTVGNTGRKAGALNQGLAAIAHRLDEYSLVLEMDADSELADDWIEQAVRLMEIEPDLAGLSGYYLAKDVEVDGPMARALAWWQKAEFARATRTRVRRDATVLSGTATIFRASALMEVRADQGYVWDPASRVEDYRITTELRVRGWVTHATHRCRTRTDVMLTPQAWWRQRTRWQLGTLEELDDRGWRTETRVDWIRQAGLYTGSLFRLLTMLFLLGFLLPTWVVYGFTFSVAWTLLFLSLGLRQAWTVREAGPGSMILAFLVIPEEIYGTARDIVAARSAWLFATGRGPSGW
ncbi:MAG: glycosyltransferase family 2 protein [Candidatus Nanopelagicales bacterium]